MREKRRLAATAIAIPPTSGTVPSKFHGAGIHCATGTRKWPSPMRTIDDRK